jgi:hypothetical protein
MISLKQAEQVLMCAPEQDCVILSSAPGTGKSSVASRAARRMSALYWPIYAATYEAVDARGLPYVFDSNAHKNVGWAAPNCLPLQIDAEKYQGKKVFVNLDDLFQAPPPVTRAFVRCIYGDGQSRHIGDFELYHNLQFCGTGNREQDRAGVYRPEQYVNDRITYVEVEPDVDEWVAGAIAGFPKGDADEGYPELRARINKAVAQGVPDSLVAYPKWTKQCYNFSTEQRSFLSPRSLERLGRFMRAFEAAGINGALLQEVATGTIGEAEAVKFMAFHKLREELPDTDAILRGEEVPLPAKTEVLYILVTAIVRAAKSQHVAAIAKLLRRLAEQRNAAGQNVGIEISAYLLGECLHGSCSKEVYAIRNQPDVIKWLSKNYNYFKD